MKLEKIRMTKMCVITKFTIIFSNWLTSISHFLTLLLWLEELVNIREHTSLGNSGLEHKLGKLVVAPQSQVDVLWRDGFSLAGFTHVSG